MHSFLVTQVLLSQVIEVKRIRLCKATWKIHLGENKGSGVEFILNDKSEFRLISWYLLKEDLSFEPLLF